MDQGSSGSSDNSIISNGASQTANSNQESAQQSNNESETLKKAHDAGLAMISSAESNAMTAVNMKSQQVLDKIDEHVPEAIKTAGKDVNEDGEVVDSSVKKLTGLAATAAAYYAGGAEGAKLAESAKANAFGDRLVGVVADAAEKQPLVKPTADLLDEAGVLDAGDDLVKLAVRATSLKDNMSAEGIVKTGESAIKAFKSSQALPKKVGGKLLGIVGGIFLFFIIIFLIIFAPIIGGFINLTDNYVSTTGNSSNNNYNLDWETSELISRVVPDFDSLSDSRKNIITYAASLVGGKYNLGGHPTGAGYSGVPSNGLDCAGYVQWVLWSALGENPGYLTTGRISDLIDKTFIEISESELKPGDIALKRRGGSLNENYNHTGIYAGNNKWFHAASTKQGIIVSNYNNFNIYLRYVGVT